MYILFHLRNTSKCMREWIHCCCCCSSSSSSFLFIFFFVFFLIIFFLFVLLSLLLVFVVVVVVLLLCLLLLLVPLVVLFFFIVLLRLLLTPFSILMALLPLLLRDTNFSLLCLNGNCRVHLETSHGGGQWVRKHWFDGHRWGGTYQQ